MTGKIAQPADIPGLPIRSVKIQLPTPTSNERAGAFEALVQNFREPRSFAADFLGQRGSEPAGPSSAKQFDADGFFGRLEAAYASKQAGFVDGPSAPLFVTGPSSVEPAEPIEMIGELPDIGLAAARLDHPNLVHQPSRPPNPRMGSASFSPNGRARIDHASARLPAEQANSEQVTGLERVRARAASPSKVPFKVFVEGNSIHVTGPIHGLSRDEESRLVDEVARLLIEHGLKPGDLLANGRQLTPNIQKGF